MNMSICILPFELGLGGSDVFLYEKYANRILYDSFMVIISAT